jgi:uncharacterized protein
MFASIYAPTPSGERYNTQSSVFVAAIRFEFHIPLVHSLKEKRAVIRPIIDGLRNRHHVSVAEVDFHDLWQRAAIGVSVVSGTVSHVDDVLNSCERFVWSFPEIEVLSAHRSWLDLDET